MLVFFCMSLPMGRYRSSFLLHLSFLVLPAKLGLTSLRCFLLSELLQKVQRCRLNAAQALFSYEREETRNNDTGKHIMRRDSDILALVGESESSQAF
jgi:hypothetical protein